MDFERSILENIYAKRNRKVFIIFDAIRNECCFKVTIHDMYPVFLIKLVVFYALLLPVELQNSLGNVC